MKKDKKTFLVLKRKVLIYNKALIYTFIYILAKIGNVEVIRQLPI